MSQLIHLNIAVESRRVRRFEPSSRTTLNGEQPYPWELLHPRDVVSRHRKNQ